MLIALVGPVRAATNAPAQYTVWPSEPPANCPFANSRDIVGIGFTDRHVVYTGADTWYPSWAADDNLYSPWADGTVENDHAMCFGTGAATGQGKIIGADPLHLQVTARGMFRGDPAPYLGRYPCGSLVYNGVWYYGTYCLNDSDGNPGTGLNWDILGPFVGFRWSTDYGQTWHDTPHTPANPLFGEPAKPGGVVRLGSPHFVDFGKNMEHSPDGKAYLVGQGASESDPYPRPANLSWGTGDQIYLARVKPSIAAMNDRTQYEFFAGYGWLGRPTWTRDLAQAKPMIDWNNHCGCVTMTYDAPLKKYLLFMTDANNTISTFTTYVLESARVTGPWQLVAAMPRFGEQGYFVNLPSKFISADGRTAWLCYSANFLPGYQGVPFRSNPPGSRYGLNLQELRLLAPGEIAARGK